jgi:hypothetical protein
MRFTPIIHILEIPSEASRHKSAPSPDTNQTMCHYIEYGEKYSDCLQPSKHVVLKKKYHKCQKAKDTGYHCVDATPAKGLNGELIQLATSRRTGACQKCLS